MKQLIPKYKDGSKYEPRKNSEGKYIINPNNPQDVKFLHELQGKRGAKAANNKGNIVKGIADAAAWVTPLGDVEDAISIYQDTKKGNYGSALLTAGLLFPSLLIPGNLNKGRKLISKSSDVPIPDEKELVALFRPKDKYTYTPNEDWDAKLRKGIESGKVKPVKNKIIEDDNYGFIIKGEYNNPKIKLYHDLIMSPNYRNFTGKVKYSSLPSVTPKVVQFSDQSAEKVYGLHYGGFDGEVYIGLNSRNPLLSTVHELASHGTDDIAKPSDWVNTFKTVLQPLMRDDRGLVVNANKWYEQRASLNEARFHLWNQLSKSLKHPASKKEFDDYIDSLDDTTLKFKTLRDSKGNDFNGYTQAYFKNIQNSSPEDQKIIIDKIRKMMKYGYGVTGVSLVGNNLLPKEQEK